MYHAALLLLTAVLTRTAFVRQRVKLQQAVALSQFQNGRLVTRWECGKNGRVMRGKTLPIIYLKETVKDKCNVPAVAKIHRKTNH